MNPHHSPRAADIAAQLQSPDPAGRDLALLRTRLYRFSDDPRWYVLAETLEERFLAGQHPLPATIAAVHACLTQIRAYGRPPPFPCEIADREGIDVTAELLARVAHSWQQIQQQGPTGRVALIVGAPRSGTSHLFNLLARTGLFAWFTTASCWAWPVRNLHHPGRRKFTEFGDEIFAVDNKCTRLLPGLVMPGEAEDIWARAIPVYRHLAGHRYQIEQPRSGHLKLLDAAARAHLAYFQRDILLAKSPFSSFRIPQIEQHYGTAVRYVHIIRDQNSTADSMRRNHFEFMVNGQALSAEQAWSAFTSAVLMDAPPDRTVTVNHQDLLHQPDTVLAQITAFLGAPACADKRQLHVSPGTEPP